MKRSETTVTSVFHPKLSGNSGGFFKRFQGQSFRSNPNSDSCPRDIKEVSLGVVVGLGSVQQMAGYEPVILVVQSYGHEVMRRWLDSDYMLLCFTEALFILKARVTSSSRSLSNEIHELLCCTSLFEQ